MSDIIKSNPCTNCITYIRCKIRFVTALKWCIEQQQYISYKTTISRAYFDTLFQACPMLREYLNERVRGNIMFNKPTKSVILREIFKLDSLENNNERHTG